MKPRLRHAATAALVCVALPLAACTTPETSGPASSGSSPAGSGTTERASGSALPTGSAPSTEGGKGSTEPGSAPASSSGGAPDTKEAAAQARLDQLSLEQRVGQVIMMGVPATGAGTRATSILADQHVGNVFLKGRSQAGVKATAAAVAKLKATVSRKTTGGVGHFISTDQEGGYVQVLKGPGFSTIPTGATQGSWSSGKLEASARKWGAELAKAGVNVNLAPVADTVPAAIGSANAPIGAFNREYGNDPASAQAGSLAFSRGMKAAGVAPVIKHFPGLGQVRQNTDVSSGVTDTAAGPEDATLAPFEAGVRDGNDWVMLSSAYYAKIDPKNPAAFSPRIIKSLLRDKVGFDGIVVSDDMCEARQFQDWKYATRAKKFFDAGGTMMLCVRESAIPAITRGLVAEAKADPAFARKIDDAALKVLTVKDGL